MGDQESASLSYMQMKLMKGMNLMNRLFRNTSVTGLTVAMLGLASGCIMAQNSFTVTRLGWLPGDDPFKSSRALSVNKFGFVVGESSGISQQFSGFLYAFQWDSVNGIQYLFPNNVNPPGLSSARSINDNGTILGNGPNLQNWSLFSGATATTLQKPIGNVFMSPQKLNNFNQSAGSLYFQDTRKQFATLWNADGSYTLLNVPGEGTFAYGINDSGVVVGEGNTISTAPSIPIIWDSVHGGSTLPFTGIGGGARAISNNGTIAGYVELVLGHTQDHAALWTSGVVNDIHRLGLASKTLDVNDAGQAIGLFAPRDVDLPSFRFLDPYRPYFSFYFSNGQMKSLLGMTDESLPYTHQGRQLQSLMFIRDQVACKLS